MSIAEDVREGGKEERERIEEDSDSDSRIDKGKAGKIPTSPPS